MPRMTFRRFALISLATALAGVALLAVAVAAGWLSAPVAALAGLAAAVLGGLLLLAVGIRRLLWRLHAGFGQTRVQLDRLNTVLTDRAGPLDRATAQVEAALTDLRAAAGEDRLELLQRLAGVDEQVRQAVQAAHDLQAAQAEGLALAQRAAQGSTAANASLPDRVYARVEGQIGLRALVEPRAPLPPLGGWALDADVMHMVATLMWQRRPDLIVECGSGSSSVWLGYLAERLGHGRVVSLEHDERFLHASRALVAAHGLGDVVEVRHAPLEPWAAGGDEPWYAAAAVEDLKQIGLLLVDGPPEALGPQVRYPAGPLLLPRCTGDAVIVLDDTDRAGEEAVSQRWLKEWPDLRRQPATRPSSAQVFLRAPDGDAAVDAR